MSLPKLICIVGPTASGKTALSLKLAKKFNGEIVSADSRQVYRGMDIGTAKIKLFKAKASGIKHYLIDVANPKQTFTVAAYQKLGRKAIKEILHQDKIPIIVGGAGLYVESLIYDSQFPPVKPNWKLRKRLEKFAAHDLFKILKKKDPARARTIEKFNKRRLIRALEITQALGKVPPLPRIKYGASSNPPPHHLNYVRGDLEQRRDGQGEGNGHKNSSFPSSPLRGEDKGGGEVLVLGLKRTEQELRKLINKRVDARVSGIIREIKKIRAQGISFHRLISFGLEYRYFSWFLQGKLTKSQASDELKKATWRFAKRQMTWFHRLPVAWIKNQKEAERKIKKFLAK